MKRRNFIFGMPFVTYALTSNVQARTHKVMDNIVLPTRSLLINNISKNKILYSNNADVVIFPASITKLMTLEIAFTCLDRKIISLDDNLVMTEYSSRKAPTKLGLKPGESILVRDAFKAITVHSCNDIASLLAEHIATNEHDFVELMNKRAMAFRMQNTVYYNATGLPDQKNISTAHDINILARNLIRLHPDKIAYFDLPDWKYKNRNYHNSNHIMGEYANMDFCKTGYIHASGFNIVFSNTYNGDRYVCVLTGCESSLERDHIIEAIMKKVFV